MTAFWFGTDEVEEEDGRGEDEDDRLITVEESASPGVVFFCTLEMGWVSRNMLSTVGDLRCLFLCDALRSAVRDRWGKEEARDWAIEWDGGKRTEEAVEREGWGSLVEATEVGGWLLCKVLFVTFDDSCSREDRLTGLLASFKLWVVWVAS